MINTETDCNTGAIADRIRSAMQMRGLTQATVARETGINQGALSAFLSGTYKGDRAAIAEKLLQWQDQRERRDRIPVGLVEAVPFVKTLTAERIMATLDYAQLAGDMVVIQSEPGAGKTATLRHFARNRPNAWLATMSADTKAPVAMLEEVGYAVANLINVSNSGGASPMRRVVENLVRDSGDILLVDEAQHLKPEALETLRAIHDATGIGMALCGNSKLLERIDGFPQLSSRIGRKLRIGRPTGEDVAALAETLGVVVDQQREFLEKVARNAGGLRSVVKTIRLAHLAADGAGEPLALTHLAKAWSNLTGGVQ